MSAFANNDVMHVPIAKRSGCCAGKCGHLVQGAQDPLDALSL